eukprot:766338-Hanusia_phi.AAC.8
MGLWSRIGAVGDDSIPENKIPDIRLFWSADKRFTSQFQGILSRSASLLMNRGQHSRKGDVSFWHPPEMHDNDVMEIIREVVGDSAEDVEEEVDGKQKEVCDMLIDKHSSVAYCIRSSMTGKGRAGMATGELRSRGKLPKEPQQK